MSASNLPPSTEEAYRKKCIELRRRMTEVEENNDATRLRRARLVRGIRKMRIERAILLDSLAKRMRKNGSGGTVFDEDSEDSTESPPTPQERPLRIKKPHRRLPDLSSPILSSALPSATTQPPVTNLPPAVSGPGAQNDPFATTSRFSKEELLPPSNLTELSTKTAPLSSAFDLFSEYFLYSLQPRLRPSDSKEDFESILQETWESLPSDVRKAWDTAEHTVKTSVERSKAAEEWKKTVGNRSRSGLSGRPVELDDDDVVMVGAEDMQRR